MIFENHFVTKKYNYVFDGEMTQRFAGSWSGGVNSEGLDDDYAGSPHVWKVKNHVPFVLRVTVLHQITYTYLSTYRRDVI